MLANISIKGALNKLTAKQQKFCREYLVDLNATQAAIRSGYSEKTAYSIGPENLKKPEIVAALVELREELAQKSALNSEKTAIDIAFQINK